MAAIPSNPTQEVVMPPVVSSSTTINKPVEAVFSFITAPESQKKMAPTLQDVKLTPPGPVALGSVYHLTSEVMGRKYETATQVSAFEQNKKWATKTINVPRSTETVYTFEPAGAGTKLTISTELNGGYPAMAEATVKAQWQKTLDETCAKFKQFLES